MVKQMEMHIRAFGMESRLNWNNEEDEYILQRIADSPLPPVIAMDGSHVKKDGGARNSAGIVMFVCNELNKVRSGRMLHGNQ